MKGLYVGSVLTWFALSTISCTNYGLIAEENSSKLVKLEIGYSKDQVLGIMGDPRKPEKYVVDSSVYDIWFYRTGHNADYMETDDEFTPIVFINGKVAGWGRNYYDKTLKVKLEQTIELKQKK
jgi:hypothetical protein